jgi:hypothetical protein
MKNSSKEWTWEMRLENYRRVMEDDPYIQETSMPQGDLEPDCAITGRWFYGVWLLGQSWVVPSKYYGGYPGNYLRRIAALFPEKRKVLHLFAGQVNTAELPGDTLDIRAQVRPTFCVDAETCAGVLLDVYDLVVADPPYSEEDSDHYGLPMVNRDKVMKVLAERLSPGCHVVWLDQVLPRYRKAEFAREAVIGLSRSTGHRFRVINIFRHL